MLNELIFIARNDLKWVIYWKYINILFKLIKGR